MSHMMGGSGGDGYFPVSQQQPGANGALVTGGGLRYNTVTGGEANPYGKPATASLSSTNTVGQSITSAQGQTNSYAARSARAHAATGAPEPSNYASSAATVAATVTSTGSGSGGHHHHHHQESPAHQAQQAKLLTDATRKVQEHAYYMRKAMDTDDLPTALDRAAHMLGELGDPHHGHHHHHHHHPPVTPGIHPPGPQRHGGGVQPQLTPKNYYELHMRALDEMPNLEEFLLTVTAAAGAKHTMRALYEAVQYCPKVVPRLYLQICAGSALIRSKEGTSKQVLRDLIEAVKCVQCPLRGLFLRHYLLQATRDKLPDVVAPAPDGGKEVEGGIVDMGIVTSTAGEEEGTVEDAYQFVLANFIEMNKLWVRIQHLPGEGKNKDQRKKRERERNELRILVGTNLVRLSQLDGISVKIYGEIILPRILDQIVACRDALAQAYLTDCIIQVFPDEFHIETLQQFLTVCPKLREKVNIRTIVQSMMDRLSNYYADEALLEDGEKKKGLSLDSFQLFDDCIQSVYQARGSNMQAREVIRLQTSLLNFSIKCYPGNMDHVNKCLGVCADSLRRTGGDGGGRTSGGGGEGGTIVQLPGNAPKTKLDDAAVDELEKLLSIPLDSLALKVLDLDHYSDLLTFLPWDNRRQVAVVMLTAVETSNEALRDVKQIEELFSIITPLIRDEDGSEGKDPEDMAGVGRTADLMAGLGVSSPGFGGTNGSVSFGESDRRRGSDGNVGTFHEEQNLVAKLVHLLHHEDTDVAYQMLSVARRHLGHGGRHRIVHTLVPVVFAALRLVQRVLPLEFPPPEQEPPEQETPEKESDNDSEQEVAAEKKEEGDTAEAGGEAGATEGNADAGATAEAVEGAAGETEEQDGEKDKAAESPQAEPSQAEPSQAEPSQAEPEKEVGGGGLFGDEESAATGPSFAKSVNCRKIFVFLQQTVAMLATSGPELALKLYLQIAVTADGCSTLSKRNQPSAGGSDFGAIAYELMAQAFLLYEDEISDSKAQHRSIVAMVGMLLACNTFSRDDYEALITKTAQYAAKLLKKPDQCKMVTLCSHLFFTGEKDDPTAYRNPQRVLECLQRALKIADACSMASPANVQLFVDILDHYVYYFERENPVITDKFISGLVALINEHMENIGSMGGSAADSSAIADAGAQYRQILRHIRKKKSDSRTAERFAPIVC